MALLSPVTTPHPLGLRTSHGQRCRHFRSQGDEYFIHPRSPTKLRPRWCRYVDEVTRSSLGGCGAISRLQTHTHAHVRARKRTDRLSQAQLEALRQREVHAVLILCRSYLLQRLCERCIGRCSTEHTGLASFERSLRNLLLHVSKETLFHTYFGFINIELTAARPDCCLSNSGVSCTSCATASSC